MVAEIRQREANIGTTGESRMKLRIRYMPVSSAPARPALPTPEVDEQPEPGGTVTPIASARDRVRRRA